MHDKICTKVERALQNRCAEAIVDGDKNPQKKNQEKNIDQKIDENNDELINDILRSFEGSKII